MWHIQNMRLKVRAALCLFMLLGAGGQSYVRAANFVTNFGNSVSEQSVMPFLQFMLGQRGSMLHELSDCQGKWASAWLCEYVQGLFQGLNM